MQKDNAKVEKISVFSSLNVKFKFLMNWIELTQFSVKSNCINLKIYVIRKCQLKTWLNDQFNLAVL